MKPVTKLMDASPDQHQQFKEVVPLAKIKTQISDKLACAVEDPRSSCMRESVSLLRLLSADDITTLAEPYLQVSERYATARPPTAGDKGPDRKAWIRGYHVGVS